MVSFFFSLHCLQFRSFYCRWRHLLTFSLDSGQRLASLTYFLSGDCQPTESTGHWKEIREADIMVDSIVQFINHKLHIYQSISGCCEIFSIMTLYVGKGRIISCFHWLSESPWCSLTTLCSEVVNGGLETRACGLISRCDALHRVVQKDSLKLNAMTFSRSQRVPIIEQGSKPKSPLSPNT